MSTTQVDWDKSHSGGSGGSTVKNIPASMLSFGECEDAPLCFTITGGGTILIIKRANGDIETYGESEGNFNNVHLEVGDKFSNSTPVTNIATGGLDPSEIPVHDISFTRDSTSSPPPDAKMSGRYYQIDT